MVADKVGMILAERNTSWPYLEDSMEWSYLTNGAKGTKAGVLIVTSQ